MFQHIGIPRFIKRILLFTVLTLFFPSPAIADFNALKDIIITYNIEAHEKSLSDGSYRGEEGILLIRPEIGKSMGLNVFINQEYRDSRALFKRAEKSLEKAKQAMASRKKEKIRGEYVQSIGDNFLRYKKDIEIAQKKILAYHLRLSIDRDERLDRPKSINVMERLWSQSLERTDFRLRDALGLFYNICQGDNKVTPHLTPENIYFVNDVFAKYTLKMDQKYRNLFDLDLMRYAPNPPDSSWKKIVKTRCALCISPIEYILQKNGDNGYYIDPLLFIALMKRESGFDPLSISSVGAVGLLQIMPQTGKNLGMKDIYMPKYFSRAMSIRDQEREKKRNAIDTLFNIDEKNRDIFAKKARDLMQQSLALKKKKESLFEKYRRELLRKRNDDRLHPEKAIEYGFAYFSKLLKKFKGDMSLALASYNAGPHRVKQYNGLPPFTETVHFRNMVLKYYREYRKMVEGAG